MFSHRLRRYDPAKPALPRPSRVAPLAALGLIGAGIFAWTRWQAVPPGGDVGTANRRGS